MHPLVRNILAVLAGFIAGSLINMFIVEAGHAIVPAPEGLDLTTAEGLKAASEQMTALHYLPPLLAHAIGTFTGAFAASLIASGRKFGPALITGIIFLIGGLVMVFMIPAPVWFIVIDLGLAYIPAAFFGHLFALRFRGK